MGSRAAGEVALGTLIALAVGVPLFTRAGFTPGSQALFLALTGPALLAAILLDDRMVARTARSLPVLMLWLLGALAIVSALWTVGDPGDAVRWGCVLAAYGALAVCGTVAADRPGGLRALAAGLCLLAAVTGIVGLVAAGARAEPYALRIGGSWRPASFFEYPPALALLQAAALPSLLRAMTIAPMRLALPSAAAAALAAAVIVLADSRFALVAAAAVVAYTLLRSVAAGRLRLAAAGLLTVAGTAAGVIAGGAAGLGETGDDLPRIAGLVLVVAAAPAVWWLSRRRPAGSVARQPGARSRRWRPHVAVAMAGLALAIALGAGAAPSLDPAASGGERHGGFTHGRTAQWEAAISTWIERPLQGWGADSFIIATRSEQPERAVRYAHNLPLEAAVELGVLGLAAALGLYGGVLAALARGRAGRAVELLGPLVALFLAANLLDWTWRLAGLSAVWALGLGAVLAGYARGHGRGDPGD